VQFVRQAEEGLAAAVDEAGSLLDTVPVIRGWLQAQLQDCLASCSDSQVVLLVSSLWVAYFQQTLSPTVSRPCHPLSADPVTHFQQNLSPTVSRPCHPLSADPVTFNRPCHLLSADPVTHFQQNLSPTVSRPCRPQSADPVTHFQQTLSPTFSRPCHPLSAEAVTPWQNLQAIVWPSCCIHLLHNQDLLSACLKMMPCGPDRILTMQACAYRVMKALQGKGHSSLTQALWKF